MKKAIVLTGGSIHSNQIFEELKEASNTDIIGIDGGCRHAYELGLNLELMIGDFDSLEEHLFEQIKVTAKQCERLNPVKNQTDTHAAFDYLEANHYNEVCVFGSIGTRFDHTLANVFVLMRYATSMWIQAKDQNNWMLLVDGSVLFKGNTDADFEGFDGPERIGEWKNPAFDGERLNNEENVEISRCFVKKSLKDYTYISIVPLEKTYVEYTKGLKYPIKDRELDPFDSYTISNEAVGYVEIRFRYGKALIIASKD